MKSRFNDIIDSCLESESAFCTAACPFHMDVKGFMEKLQRGAFGAAFKIYRNAVAFPRIVGELCGGRCRSVCPREQTDAAPNMSLLEKAAVKFAANTKPNRYTLPAKDACVAIIGAGPGGLACALRLASRRYDVTVFEKSGRIGGHLWDILSPDLFLPDIDEQFMYEKYKLNLNSEILTLEELSGYDAVYIATGAGGNSFGLSQDPGGAFASDRPGVFLGGALTGSDSIQAIADGLHAVLAIERYIKTGAMNHPPESSHTCIVADPSRLVYAPPISPADGAAFSKEEAAAEAARCLRCACDACIRRCDLMEFYKKFPKRIRDEVAITIDPASLDGEETFAKRLMGTCNQCGMCADACPQGIDTGEFLLESRRAMHKKGKLPWAFHEFWIRDMRHALSEESVLVRVPGGVAKPEYVFFPGCQLGASDPDYVLESYRWLLSEKPDTALWLGCCGAPAVWAGDDELCDDTFALLHSQWKNLGNPIPIFACPTCKQMFQRYMPETGGVFLFEFMCRNGFTPKRSLDSAACCIFDPCSSRHQRELQDSVRELAKSAGTVLTALPDERELAKCCSWGGHVSIANPDYAKGVIRKRIEQSELPYITYCVNCRDTFSEAGKQSVHLLDILFDLNLWNRPAPGCNDRRKNRIRLRSLALREFWNEEEPPPSESAAAITVHISEALHAKMAADLVLEEDVLQTVARCEAGGRTVTDKTTGHLCGYAVIGRTTCWVEYKRLSEGEYVLVNAYCHRMTVDLEETWNGQKTRDDL